MNRLLVPYMVEAVSLLEEGYSIKTIDQTMEKFGMPMGPIELFDEVGIDVAYKVAKILTKSMGEHMAESDLLHTLVENKRYGKKTGVGFYRYEGKKKIIDNKITSYISKREVAHLTEKELVYRMVYPMVNEAARCLEDKIVPHPRYVDLGMIFGTGFAPFRGGLLNFADMEGITKIIDTLVSYAERYGKRFQPCTMLKQIGSTAKSFYEFYNN